MILIISTQGTKPNKLLDFNDFPVVVIYKSLLSQATNLEAKVRTNYKPLDSVRSPITFTFQFALSVSLCSGSDLHGFSHLEPPSSITFLFQSFYQISLLISTLFTQNQTHHLPVYAVFPERPYHRTHLLHIKATSLSSTGC